MDIIIVDHFQEIVYTTFPLSQITLPAESLSSCTGRYRNWYLNTERKNNRHYILIRELNIKTPEALNYSCQSLVTAPMLVEIPETTSLVTRTSYGMFIETIFDLTTKNERK